MQLTYDALNKLSYQDLQKIQRDILDKFHEGERQRQNLISDILRLQTLGSLWAMNNKKQP